MKSLSQSQPNEQEQVSYQAPALTRYQAPAIVYEGEITTRAGSAFGGLTSDDPEYLDPNSLFGQ
ncbi:MAG TPA: hypothetical protein VLL52_25660 [Anaerolineae bacterium]|nr:hypothetical protein [Anaerolineae bacterium]